MRAPKMTIHSARHLRRALAMPEVRLWNRLRKRIPGHPVFRRQHPIGPYVLDFYCTTARLAVEIDGISHDMADRSIHCGFVRSMNDGRPGLWIPGSALRAPPE